MRHAAQERLTLALHPALNGAGQYVTRTRADRARAAVEEFLTEGEAPPKLDRTRIPVHIVAALEEGTTA